MWRPLFLTLFAALSASDVWASGSGRMSASRLALMRGHAHAARRSGDTVTFELTHGAQSVTWVKRGELTGQQIPSDAFTEDREVMGDMAPSGKSTGAPSCNPKCYWKCTDPSCEDSCEPLCTSPICQTRCPRINFMPLCKETCDHPDCLVVCPQNKCSSGHCPQCKTLCGSPKCKVACDKPPDGCEAVCEEPLCEWKCKHSDSCEAPACKMICEDKLDCSDTNDKTNELLLPPKKESEIPVGKFQAKLS